MNERLNAYLVSKIWSDIRTGRASPLLADHELARAIVHHPLIDDLRELATEDDVEHLKLYINSEDVSVQSIGTTLIRNLRHLPGVRRLFIERWQGPGGYKTKWTSMWRLLDYEDLEPEIQYEILDFVHKYREQWVEGCLTHYNTGVEGEDLWEGALKAINARLSDKDFPETKSWVYLLLASFHPDQARVCKVLEGHLQAALESGHPVRVTVAKKFTNSDGS